MSRVFAVHQVRERDLSPAENFGRLVYINPRYVYGDEMEGEELPPVFADAMRRAAQMFNPRQDYLLIAGDHLQVVAMSAYLARMYGRFRVLRFDREIKGYLPALIDAV